MSKRPKKAILPREWHSKQPFVVPNSQQIPNLSPGHQYVWMLAHCYMLCFINDDTLVYITNEIFYCCQTGGGAAAGGDKGAEPKKEVEELVLEDITIGFLKQV